MTADADREQVIRWITEHAHPDAAASNSQRVGAGCRSAASLDVQRPVLPAASSTSRFDSNRA